MKRIVFGRSAWQPFERQIWMMSISASVVWIFYVVVVDVILFTPQSFERLESTYFRSNARTTQEQMERLLLGPSAQDVARMEGRISRNTERRARNNSVEEYNKTYIFRALKKAIVVPIAWLAALLTFITIYERMRLAEKSDGSEN